MRALRNCYMKYLYIWYLDLQIQCIKGQTFITRANLQKICMELRNYRLIRNITRTDIKLQKTPQHIEADSRKHKKVQ
jgi:hypothetical protein